MPSYMSSFPQWGSYVAPPQWNNMPFPIFQGAVSEAEQATQAPIKMASHCAANAVFAAVQGLGDYQRPGEDVGVSPLTNISLIIGETGERKSSVDACFFKEIFMFRDEQSKASDHADVEHGVRMKVWRLEEKILDKRLAASLAGGDANREHLMEALKEHAWRRPKRAANAIFLYQDTSLASLKLGLASFPSACVHSTEGMSILEGALFEEKNLLCTLNSGETHLYDRLGKRIALKDKRLCVSAHSQPKRTMRHFESMGDEFRDSGLAARMTFCLLISKVGYRTHDAVGIPTTCRDRFDDRVRYLLKASERAGKRSAFQRRRIKFSASVAREYLEYANWIEREMRPNGKFQSARDYGNRLADKVGRFSSALHVFEDFEGDISFETFSAARSFYEEEANDFLYLFNYLPSEQFQADQLMQWLQHRQPKFGAHELKKSDIQQRCLVRFRRKAALDPVLDLLEQQGKLHMETSRNMETLKSTVYVLPGPKPAYGVAQHLPSAL